jgi:hypothetical protein
MRCVWGDVLAWARGDATLRLAAIIAEDSGSGNRRLFNCAVDSEWCSSMGPGGRFRTSSRRNVPRAQIGQFEFFLALAGNKFM